MIVAGCRDAQSARQLGFVPAHGLGAALEMARGARRTTRHRAIWLGARRYRASLVGRRAESTNACQPASRGSPVIETQALTKKFGDRAAVDGVDLVVPAGVGIRLPRPERRRQDDADPHAASA